MAKKIPYGLTDYVLVMTDNYYYVDKTQYIDLLEQTFPVSDPSAPFGEIVVPEYA